MTLAPLSEPQRLFTSWATLARAGSSPEGDDSVEGVVADTDYPTLQTRVDWLLAKDLPPEEWSERLGRARGCEFPKAGDAFLDFALVRELGRGSFGRVYLAMQRSLAGRLVAVKVSSDPSDEIQTLAKMQHAYIMPIYSTLELPGSLGGPPLQAAVMPYFGSTTLADICLDLGRRKSTPETVRYLVDTLEVRRRQIENSLAASAPSPTPGARSPLADLPPGPDTAALGKVGDQRYVDAVLLLAQRIAEGLAHAHERGIVHRDLKPANVLLTDDGLPMILDFNLAVDRASARTAAPGGTVPYMSPEQLSGFAGSDPKPVDFRTDIYSLGLVLYELLTRRRCFALPAGPIAQALPAMLADRRTRPIRFGDGNPDITPAVQAIVRRCLRADPADRYPSARALAEDIERHRAHRPLLHAGEPSLQERFRKWRRRNPKLVSPTALSGLAASAALLGIGLAAAAAADRREADRVRNAEAGREILRAFRTEGDIARQYYAARTDAATWNGEGTKSGLAALGRVGALENGRWLDRPEFAHLGGGERAELRDRAAELGILLSLAEPALREKLRDVPLLEEKGPFLRAADLQAQRKYRESLEVLLPLERAAPGVAEYHFLIGRAHQMLGDYSKAYRSYSVGIALRPDFGPGYFNRAQVGSELKLADVEYDLEKAAELEPDNGEVRFLQARWLARSRRLPAARAALDAVVRTGTAPARVWYLRARLDELMNDGAAAARDRARGKATEPTDARDYVLRGLDRMAAEPEAALADFRAAEALDPTAIEPLQNQAHVEGKLLGHPDRAIAILDRLLQQNPDFSEGRDSRAIYLARTGRNAEALAAARTMVASPGKFTLYRAACTYALLSRTDPQYAAPAVKYLAAALEAGFGCETVAKDADLDALRGRPEFKAIAEFARTTQALKKRDD